MTPDLEQQEQGQELKHFVSDKALSLYNRIFNVKLEGDLDGKLEVTLKKGSLHIYPEGSLVCIYPDNDLKNAYAYSTDNPDMYEAMLKKLAEIL